jgi:potassium-transporting ATPase KdpC subunit
MLTHIKTSVIATLVLALILCGAYPLIVWGAAQILFPRQANGSLVEKNGKIVASTLIAQPFSDARYFHPRPSAAGAGYDGSASSGSNLGPTSKKLIDAIDQRVQEYRKTNGLIENAVVPADAVTASASGLDPHISPANAALQAPRVATARGISVDRVILLVDQCTEGADLGLLGERRVNVVRLNLALDEMR